jgi:NRPS condensation-like uncharacterized protein
MPDPVKLDTMSELMALSSVGNTKNIILMAVEAKGPFDEAAFRSALKEASAAFPAIASNLRETRDNGRFFLFREFNPELELKVTVSDVKTSGGPEGSFDTLVRHLRPRLDRNWDLLHEPPVEIHVLRLEPQHVLLAFMFHHSAADAAMALRVISETLGQYDAIVMGRKSEWAAMPYVFSTGKKKALRASKGSLKHFVSQLIRTLKDGRLRPVHPDGAGRPSDLTEWHLRKVFSTEDTQAIHENATKEGIRVVDRLVACSNLALDAWNASRNVASGIVTSVVTVNMRERFGGEEERNYSSSIFFRSVPQDRKDALEFSRAVAAHRTKQLTRQMDLMVRKSFSMGASFFTLFPFGIRSSAADFFMRQQRFSVAVGFLGIVWPDLKDGRFSEESRLRRAGEFDIADVHGTGYKLAGNAHVNLYSYIYNSRLHLVLAVSASLLSREEAEDFLELLTRTITGSLRTV